MHRSRHPRAARALAGVTATAALAALPGCGAGTPPPTVPKHIALANTAEAAVNPITVSPLPGTPDASPSTQISFLGPSGTTLSDVKVVGSHSGSHSGRTEAYSTGTGESFLPVKPFEQGEH